tara:strand:- start:362 stop:583 length:222 start_codon:yes stop_codon:yes gene_type:complete
VIFSSLVGGWTITILIFNTPFKIEIKEVINKMYLNQKNFIVNVKDLSLLLVKDAHERFSEDQQDFINLNSIKN